MDREAYNQCMAPYMQGQKSKEQRQFDMCVGAKLCTGKASTREEAEQICSVPKLPKWAKAALPDVEDVSCPEKMQRTLDHLDLIALKVHEGEAGEAKGLAALVLNDTISCRPEMVTGLIDQAMAEVNSLGKRFYLKGEAKEVERQIKVIKEVLNA
jgi:hypothetical protein